MTIKGYPAQKNKSPAILISVIMPTLNAADSIPRALKSIASQTLREIEVIISDGGSSDQTIELSKKLLSLYGVSHTIIQREGSPIYSSLNLGAKIAKGEWIYCIGSDDKIASPTTLQEASKALKDNRHNVVYGGIINVAEGDLVMNGQYTAKSLGRMSIPHQAIFYRRSYLAKHNLEYNEYYPIEADWDLNLRLWKLTRFYYINLIVAIYGGAGVSSPQRQTASPLKDNLGKVLLSYYGLRAFRFLPSYRLADACRTHPNPIFRITFSIIRAGEALSRLIT